MRNGNQENEPLSQGNFQSFITNEWKPHTSGIDKALRTLADSMASIAGTFSWAAKALMTLLVLLILLNGGQTFINQLRDTGTSFKGHIGGENGAAIELRQEQNK